MYSITENQYVGMVNKVEPPKKQIMLKHCKVATDTSLAGKYGDSAPHINIASS